MSIATLEKNYGRRRSPRAARIRKDFSDLGRAEIHRLRAARIRLDVERDLLALVQRAHACRFNCGCVHEHVFAAAFRRNEAVALRRVEKLHCSNRHVCSSMASFRQATCCGGASGPSTSEVRLSRPGALWAVGGKTSALRRTDA